MLNFCPFHKWLSLHFSSHPFSVVREKLMHVFFWGEWFSGFYSWSANLGYSRKTQMSADEHMVTWEVLCSYFSSYQVTSFTFAVIWSGENNSRVPELVKWDWNTPCCIVQMTKNINCIWPLPVDNFLEKAEAYAECCPLRTWFISHIRLPYRDFINELNRSKTWFLNNIPRLRRNSRVHVAQPYASLLLICISWHFLLFYYILILS